MNLWLRSPGRLYKQIIPFLARSYNTKLPSDFVIVQDRDMVICWHQQEPFPYECTKPIPVKESLPESVLKIGSKEVKAIFTKPNQEILPEELGKLTYTCKHRWYPRARDKKAKKTEPDRKYM